MYTVLPFGISTAPAEWQLYLESVLWEHLGHHVTIHLDDILVFTNDSDHVRVSKAVEDALRKKNLKLKESKCVRGKREIDYCGHHYGYGKAPAILSDRTIYDCSALVPPTDKICAIISRRLTPSERN